MPEKHESVVRRIVDDVWNKGNLKLVDELFTPDYVNNDPMNPTRGPQGMKDLVNKYRGGFPDLRLDIDELFSIGDRVVVRWRCGGTHLKTLEGIQPTGRRVITPGITIYRFQGDRIAEAHTNWDALGFLQQLGVVTLPGKVGQAGA